MDIGTKDEQAHELDTSAANEVSGGQVLPDEELPADPLGPAGGMPMDYSAVSGGLDDPQPASQPSDNPVWRVLQDWFGGTQE